MRPQLTAVPTKSAVDKDGPTLIRVGDNELSPESEAGSSTPRFPWGARWEKIVESPSNGKFEFSQVVFESLTLSEQL